jgi:hypothetical protein
MELEVEGAEDEHESVMREDPSNTSANNEGKHTSR